MNLEAFPANGFAIARGLFTREEIETIAGDLPGLDGAAGSRGLLAIDRFATLARDQRLLDMVKTIHEMDGRPVRGILFDKSPTVNWTLGWHQDSKIAVDKKNDQEGYTSWSTKEGVHHCRPPLAVLEGMLALRIAIDLNDETNGPLRVIPGTHRLGLLSRQEIAEYATQTSVACLAEPGDVIAMHPLTLHASGKVTSDARRRVIQFEYATVDLPGAVRWAFVDQVASNAA